jgi:hypothetical protein
MVDHAKTVRYLANAFVLVKKVTEVHQVFKVQEEILVFQVIQDQVASKD